MKAKKLLRKEKKNKKRTKQPQHTYRIPHIYAPINEMRGKNK
jgi:hypothetical protein